VIEQKYPDKAAEILASSCFTINGYADRTGNYKKNQTLSESRAHSVAKALVTASGGKIINNNYIVYGKGDTECTRTDYPKKADLAKCRRVDIVLNSGSCSAPVAE
jgi:outer membrane protein OmpA-like peptidoglycan-associated protein